jgi:hypothetical protein
MGMLGLGALLSACASDTDPDVGEDDLKGKPKQFVAFAFDGSYNNAFWQESLDFAATVKKADGKPALKYTYFVNPSYYLADEFKNNYCPPHLASCGKSAIGFGGLRADVGVRITKTADAAAQGHAIESHAVGHYDGSTWTADQWRKEFDQFDKIFFKNGQGAERDALLPIKAKGIVGFRAPQLGYSPGLYEVLRERGYTYDTSKSNKPNYWPEKINGVWNFPLAELVLKNSGKKTLSMDYNHYYGHTKGVSDSTPANVEKYRKDVFDTYMAYFNANLNGNRAPLHIGHHFSKWNGGAYWSAMKDFANAVCKRVDVECGTYRDLVALMESLTPGQRTKLQAGNFTGGTGPCTASDDPSTCVVESPDSHDDSAHDETPDMTPVDQQP